MIFEAPRQPDILQHWLNQLAMIFARLAPGFDVWAYGSRTTGHCHEGSDLDLVLIYHPTHPQTARCEHYAKICETLSESNIPICVDVMDWARVPIAFQVTIDQQKIKLFDATTVSTTGEQVNQIRCLND